MKELLRYIFVGMNPGYWIWLSRSLREDWNMLITLSLFIPAFAAQLWVLRILLKNPPTQVEDNDGTKSEHYKI